MTPTATTHPAEPSRRYRATAVQERHWFLHHYESDPSSQNHALVAEYHGAAGPNEIFAASRLALFRHPELMQRFESTSGMVWVEPSTESLPVNIVQADSEEGLNRILRDAQRRPLDPDAGVTARLDIAIHDGTTWLCFVAHSCVVDRHSLRIIMLEIASELRLETNQSSCTIATNQDAAGPPRNTEEDESYWVGRVGERPVSLELPASAPRPYTKQHSAAASTIILPQELVSRIDTISRQLRCSLRATYLASFLSTLRRWTGQEELVVGLYLDLRKPESINSIGPFTDQLPFRYDFQPGTTMGSLICQIDALIREDQAHSTISFHRLTQLLKVERDPSRHPIHQAAFSFADKGPINIRNGSESLIEVIDREVHRCPYDVELRVETEEARTALTLLFDEELYPANIMRGFLEHCVNVLKQADSPADVDDIDLLTAAERTQILQMGRGCSAALGHDTVHRLFSEAAKYHADRLALVFRGFRMSYRELDEASSRTARLLSVLEIGSGSCVGICMDRSPEMVITLLGILKTGAAYVPMDPTYPAERLGTMVEDSSASLVVTHESHIQRLPVGCRVAVYEELNSGPNGIRTDWDGHAGGPEDLAYIIFTSGSTGRPKGVAMPHRALVNLIEWQLERRTFASNANVLQYSSLSFDVSFQEIFSTFASGGTLHLIDDADRRDPRRLLDALVESRIQRLFLPYVALRQLIEVAHATARFPQSLEEVITAGEQLRVDDALKDFFRRLDRATLDNQYGPSETHVVTAQMLSGDPTDWPALPPIGQPIRNNQTLILDHRGALVPIGVAGELYLAGTNVARGYYRRDDLSAERFVPCAWTDGPAYKTGDAARYLPDGSIAFLGRRDFQVKVRGHRIEPNEVNDVLGRIHGIKQCLTRAFESAHGGTRLVSYLLVEDPSAFDTEAVFKHARQILPEYMVPAAVVPLSELPFTPSGKLDIRALPIPDEPTRTARQLLPPRNPTEAKLVEIWRDLLHLKEVGIEESFFDVGGDSLLAVQLFLAIERQLGKELPLSVLAEHPTVAALAAAIDGNAMDELSGFRSLRRIQLGIVGKTPLFLVHGGGGNVILFRGLARAISRDLPVYAFQWEGWGGKTARKTIEQMAQLYVEELCRFHTAGPFRLGGHCIGGLIAMEMARELKRRGYDVIDPLFITDSPNLRATSYRSSMPAEGSAEMNALATEEARLIEALALCESHPDSDRETFEQPAHHRSRARQLLRRGYRLLTRRRLNDTVLDRLALKINLSLGRRVPLEYRALYAATSLVRAAQLYSPTPYAGSVVYFRTRLFLGRQLGLQGWWEDTCLGFDELCPDGFEVHYVNATHNGVLDHPMTAQLIRQAIDS